VICLSLQLFQNGQTARTHLAKMTDQLICSPERDIRELDPGVPLLGPHQWLNRRENKRFMEDHTGCSVTFARPNRRLGP
jgi:hypothetical protein